MSILATLTTSTMLGGVADAARFDPPDPLAAVFDVVGEFEGFAEEPVPATEPPSETLSLAVTQPPRTLPPLPTGTTMPELTLADIDGMRAEADPPALPVPPAPSDPMDVVVSFSIAGVAPFERVPVTRDDCIRQAKTSPVKIDDAYDRNLIAQMTHGVFECLTGLAGLDVAAPTALRRWNGGAIWGFGSLAEQVAAEAVVVAYCESKGFSPEALTGANGFGYAGLFQMGRTEMGRFGEAGASRYDPVDNAVGAANYFIYQYQNRAGWGGWSPWAVVNTNFDDDVNNQVKVPILPRFTSTDPDFKGRPGPELPAWAADPWSWEVPHWNGTGCPYNGGRWPNATPLPTEASVGTEG